MFRIPKFLVGSVLVVLALGVLFFGIVQIVSCTTGPNSVIDHTNRPDENEATYSIFIENTGRLLYTDNLETYGSTPGSRIFVLNGFWDYQVDKFIYHETKLTLDESIFGIVSVIKR